MRDGGDVPSSYGDVFKGDANWQGLPVPTGDTYAWDGQFDVRTESAVLRGHDAHSPAPVEGHQGRAGAGEARAQRYDGSHLAGWFDQAKQSRRKISDRARRRAEGLQLLWVAPRQSRSHDARDVCECPPAQQTRRRSKADSRGTCRSNEQMSIYDAAMKYKQEGVPLIILAGQGIRVGFLARLGGEGPEAARRACRHRRKLRAHSPLEPRRHGHCAAAIPERSRCRHSRADRRRNIRDRRTSRRARRTSRRARR